MQGLLVQDWAITRYWQRYWLTEEVTGHFPGWLSGFLSNLLFLFSWILQRAGSTTVSRWLDLLMKSDWHICLLKLRWEGRKSCHVFLFVHVIINRFDIDLLQTCLVNALWPCHTLGENADPLWWLLISRSLMDRVLLCGLLCWNMGRIYGRLVPHEACLILLHLRYLVKRTRVGPWLNAHVLVVVQLELFKVLQYRVLLLISDCKILHHVSFLVAQIFSDLILFLLFSQRFLLHDFLD